MHRILRLILPAFYLLVSACSISPKEIKIAEQLMETHPDSSLKLLRSVEAHHLCSDKNRALYGVLLFQALDKNELALQPDTLINFAIEYFDRKSDQVHLAMSYFYKARMFKHACQYDVATEFYLKALDANQDKNNYPLLSLIYSDMGEICTVQQDHLKARKRFTLAVDCYRQSGNLIEAGYHTLDIGKTYNFSNEHSKALRYFQQALQFSKDSMLLGIAFQEIGVNYYNNQQLDSAMHYLRRSLKYPYSNNNYSNRCCALSDLFLTEHQYDSAYVYASKALLHPSSIFTQRDCYRIFVNIESARGDIHKMGANVIHYQICNDSIRKIESQTKVAVIENLHNATQIAEKARKQGSCLLCSLLLSLATGAFLYFWFKKRHKTERLKIEQLHRQAKEKLRKEEIFKHRDVLVHKIETIKAKQVGIRKNATAPERNEMDKALYHQVLHFNDTVAFFSEMDALFNALPSKLKKRYPTLTSKEISWCCLSLLNIPHADILLLLDYMPDSLNKMKQRLAQKTKLLSVSELHDFLHSILSAA